MTALILWLICSLITGSYFILTQRKALGYIHGGYILLYSIGALAGGPFLLAGLLIQYPLMKFIEHKF